MTEYKLDIVIFEVALFDFADDSFKVDDCNHFILVRGASTKVEAAALKLKDAVCLRF